MIQKIKDNILPSEETMKNKNICYTLVMWINILQIFYVKQTIRIFL